MAAIKCIILESWTRINPDLGIYESRSVYVTDEAGNPVIYDSLTEARAEIRSNGYRIGNSDRAHDPETTDINGTRHESWIQIIREGSAEYAEATAAETAALEALEEYGNAEDAINAAAYGIYADRHAGALPDVTDADQTQELDNLMQQVAAIIAERLTIEAVSTAHAAIEAEDLETAEDLAKQAEAIAEQAEAAADQAGTEHAHDGAELARWKAEAAQNTISDATDREQVAEILASIEDSATRDYYAAEVSESGWSAEELTEAIQYRRDIIAANAAALALLDAYAAVIGEHPAEDDPETIAAYMVARDEIRGSHARATAEELEIVADMIEAIADDVRDTIAARLEFATRPADLTAYQSEFCTFEPTREIYQRAELIAYLGDYTDDYDVDAIEAEVTEYDPKTSRTYWKRDTDLWEVCERHEIAAYYPATA